MKIRDILSMSTVYGNIHESVYQSYHLLRTVEDLLRRGTSGDVVLELLDEIKEMAEAQKKPDTSLTDEQTVNAINEIGARATNRVRTGN